jgi:hypothetical protein
MRTTTMMKTQRRTSKGHTWCQWHMYFFGIKCIITTLSRTVNHWAIIRRSSQCTIILQKTLEYLLGISCRRTAQKHCSTVTICIQELPDIVHPHPHSTNNTLQAREKSISFNANTRSQKRTRSMKEEKTCCTITQN